MTPMLLILIAPPDAEEAVIDWLLAQEGITGFTGHHGFGHSTEHGQFSLAEQVTGRQSRVMFHIETAAGEAQPLVESLRTGLPRLGLHYWLLPLAETGRLA